MTFDVGSGFLTVTPEAQNHVGDTSGPREDIPEHTGHLARAFRFNNPVVVQLAH